MKIFAIGLSRTGTTSLTKAIELLGYKCKHFPRYDCRKGSVEILSSELKNYDFLSDTPVALDYKRLDKLYMNSKFIYTTRDVDEWIASCKKFERFGSNFAADQSIIFLRNKIYGSKFFDEERFRIAYKKHNKDVMSYFQKRKNDLLVINICKGHGWAELCSFLDCSIPKIVFPWLNSNCKNTNSNE